ncbi:MAG: ROK family transcriptional regulator [Gemmatimonadota bacterium]
MAGIALGVGWRARLTGQRSLTDAVLHLIWEQRKISRAEIARLTGLSRSTVSEIVTGLLATGLVAEVGEGPSRGGRRPVVLEFQDDAFVILGVDMGASHVSVVLTDLRGGVLAWEHRDFPVRSDPEGTAALILEFCRACLVKWGGKRRRLVGIGVGVPSPVDPRSPDRLSPQVLPAWRGRSVLDQLELEFGVTVLVDNDANLGALAEHWWGAGRGLDDFAFIKVATGVGSGHFLGGRIYRGATGVAGEIGQMTIDPHGSLCMCGNRGCLALYVGTQALVARAKRLLPEFPGSVLAGTEPTIGAIEDAALADDPLAMKVVLEAAEYLGIAVADLINLMNPAAVIMGGRLSRLGERLLAPLREAARRRTFVGADAASHLRTGELGPRDVAIGAATLVLDAALTDPSLFPTAGSS